MTACTCQYDHDRAAYVHVCDFHRPALERLPTGRYLLAGRDVTAAAANGAPGLATRARSLEDLDAALEGRRAAKRATLEEAEQRAAEGLSRIDRRKRGERSVYGAHLGNLTGRRLRGRR